MSWSGAVVLTPELEAELLAELKERTGIEAGVRVRFVNAHPHAQKEGTVEGWEQTARGIRPAVLLDDGERIIVPRVDLLEVCKGEGSS